MSKVGGKLKYAVPYSTTENTMDKIIKDAERFDLSGADILRITDHKTRILPYEALEKVSDLEEILRPHGSVIILYQTAEQFGHWVALLNDGGNRLEFYDPYGLNVDEELELDNEFHLRIHGGKITPHLSALIKKGGWSVKYNKDRLQKRVRFRDLSMEEFNSLLTKNKAYHPDFWVSALTLLC
jgi:hypothetical protein